MLATILSTLLFGIVAILMFFLNKRRRPQNFPPGPPILPIVGSIPFMEMDMLKAITSLRKKFGSVFSLGVGPDTWVVICDLDLLKEALSREEIQSRPIEGALNDFSFRDAHGEVCGIFFSNGSEWQEQRRFALKNLRDFGFAKITMEHLIHEEAQKSMEMIKEDIKPGKPISLVLRLNVAILNALWQLVTSEKHDYDDPELKFIINKINDLFVATQFSGPLFMFPWMKTIAPELIGYNKAKRTFEAVHELIGKNYKKHLESFQPDQLRDFMDVFINQINNEKDNPNSSFHGQRGLHNMYAGLVNLFIGGTETTSNTLNWALFHLSKNPEIQEKAVAEIYRVVGKDRLPSLADRPLTPYVEACVLETHRISSLAYLGVPRIATKDLNLGPYSITKGTFVVGGIHEIHHDPALWTDPDTFQPERFIDPETGKIKGAEKLMTFGYGRRQCIGSTLAQVELYLFLAAFLQRFKFANPTPDVLKPIAGILLGCPEFKMTITERMITN